MNADRTAVALLIIFTVAVSSCFCNEKTKIKFELQGVPEALDLDVEFTGIPNEINLGIELAGIPPEIHFNADVNGLPQELSIKFGVTITTIVRLLALFGGGNGIYLINKGSGSKENSLVRALSTTLAGGAMIIGSVQTLWWSNTFTTDDKKKSMR